MIYQPGHIRRHPATKRSATRTIYDDTDPAYSGQAWVVVNPAGGPYPTTTAEVEGDGWEDSHVEPAPE